MVNQHQSDISVTPVLFLLTLCPAGWSRSLVQQDSVHTGRRASPRWPPPQSEAPGVSGSCGLAASTPGWCLAALRVAQPPQKRWSWRRAGGGGWRSWCCYCWYPDPALKEESSHRGRPAGGRRCTGSTAYLNIRHRRRTKSAWTVSNPTQQINPSRAGRYGLKI